MGRATPYSGPMPPRRQTHPLASVRAASAVNDSLTEAQVRANAGVQGTAEDLVNVIATQLRRALGAQSWLFPPVLSPGSGGGGGRLVYQEVLAGVKDGENVTFMLAAAANPSTIEVSLNGLPLLMDAYRVAESAPGAGFNSVVLNIGAGPRERDVVTASYDPA